MGIGPSDLVVWFALASAAGWLFESAYSVVRTGRWEKRGFLFGPICPIYGVGAVAALVLFDRPEVADGAFPVWAVFLCSMAGSAFMEYAVSVALERMFGAVWWDYSDLPLNVNGRICLPASILFGAAGTAIAYLAISAVHAVDTAVPPIVFEVSALAITFALGMDLAMTVASLSDLMKKIASLSIEANSRIDTRVRQAAATVRSLPAKTREGGEAARASIAMSQERLRQVADSLTERQLKLLSQLKRFSSRNARENAMLLLDSVRRRSNDGSGE